MAIDLDALKEIMDNDRALMQECLDDFLLDYPDLISDLRAAVSDRSFEGIEHTAHKLKGILRYLAAGPAAEAALAVETAGRNRDPENLAEKLAALEYRCGQTMAWINALPG